MTKDYRAIGKLIVLGRCIYCGFLFEVSPPANTKCPSCGKFGYVHVNGEAKSNSSLQGPEKTPKAKKQYATRLQKLLLKKAGEQAKKGLTSADAKARIQALLNSGKLTIEDVMQPRRLEPATEKQIAYLLDLGITAPPILTKGEASELIGQAHEKKAMGIPMTDGQKDFILRLGGRPEAGMSSYHASKYITWLLGLQISCPKCGCNISPFLERCDMCGGFLPKASLSNRVPPSIVTHSDLRETKHPSAPKAKAQDSIISRLITFLGRLY